MNNNANYSYAEGNKVHYVKKRKENHLLISVLCSVQNSVLQINYFLKLEVIWVPTHYFYIILVIFYFCFSFLFVQLETLKIENKHIDYDLFGLSLSLLISTVYTTFASQHMLCLFNICIGLIIKLKYPNQRWPCVHSEWCPCYPAFQQWQKDMGRIVHNVILVERASCMGFLWSCGKNI